MHRPDVTRVLGKCGWDHPVLNASEMRLLDPMDYVHENHSGELLALARIC